MPTYRGGCHCGAVRFEVSKDKPANRLIDCNCSICTKKGILHVSVENSEFQLLSGRISLSLYRFGSETARHEFCGKCGIHVFGRPRLHPERMTVNARCLDDFEAIRAAAKIELERDAKKVFSPKNVLSLPITVQNGAISRNTPVPTRIARFKISLFSRSIMANTNSIVMLTVNAKNTEISGPIW